MHELIGAQVDMKTSGPGQEKAADAALGGAQCGEQRGPGLKKTKSPVATPCVAERKHEQRNKGWAGNKKGVLPSESEWWTARQAAHRVRVSTAAW